MNMVTVYASNAMLWLGNIYDDENKSRECDGSGEFMSSPAQIILDYHHCHRVN